MLLQHRRHDRVAVHCRAGPAARRTRACTPRWWSHGPCTANCHRFRKKRPLALSAMNAHRLLGEPVGQVLARRPGRDRPLAKAVGRPVAVRPRRARVGDAMEARRRSRAARANARCGRAEVPLAEVPRAVAGVAQRRRERRLVRWQVAPALRRDHAPVRRRRLRKGGSVVGAVQVAVGRGHSEPGRVLAGQDAGPRRRAQRRCRVRIREQRPPSGEARRCSESRNRCSRSARVAPAHVVDHEQDDVRAAAGHAAMVSGASPPAQCDVQHEPLPSARLCSVVDEPHAGLPPGPRMPARCRRSAGGHGRWRCSRRVARATGSASRCDSLRLRRS